MESVHGVDVSWLHRPQKDGAGRPRAPSSPAAPLRDLAAAPAPPAKEPARSTSVHENAAPKQIARVNTEPLPSPPATAAPATVAEPVAQPDNVPARPSRRPSVLSRTGADKNTTEGGKPGRRASWISNISSRFSSTSSPLPSPASPQVSRPIVNGSHATSPGADLERLASPQLSPALTRGNPMDEMQPYVPQRPKESGSSFFSSITKRLASGAQGGANSKFENGGVCERRTLNVNPNRARCRLSELDHSKLRRVSFSVDVEIASGPKYKDDAPAVDSAKKSKDKKIKERAEGEALKNPKVATEVKDEKDDSGEKAGSIDEALAVTNGETSPVDDQPADHNDHKAMTRKQEKKKKSEEERKERKERRRKRAEETGMAPVEYRDEDDSKDSSRSASVDKAPPTVPKPNDRPTTDPVRIYRRCCQLRESPILKRITEQLMAPNCTAPGDSGTVTCLNLTGSRLQLADFITLGDWLAIVPVRRLLLEDADISDEGLRVVLAGLLASKKPEPTRVKNRNLQAKNTPERAGVIERLTLKNNPRITRIGWKHIAVFLNMCRSIKAVDVSMIAFPETMPTGKSGQIAEPNAQPVTTDAAEIFAKAISERVAGNKLEELIMSECALNSSQIQRILEAAVTAGITRFGLAGTDLDIDGFHHVLDYIRSGICEIVDIGSNYMDNERMTQLAEALTKPDLPIWGLSFAACGLNAAMLKILFPALVKLPLLRFVDLSHNRALFENDTPDTVQLLRKYIPQLQNLKRIHLMDVGINAKQTIGIAEVLPEGPALAHIGLLENSELSKLVTNTDEASQEEACALYASLMAAVRVSTTLICIDIDVPAPDNSEVVKALAKQVLAYCLRNMELTPLSTVTHNIPGTPKPKLPEGTHTITYPDVLQHLVGHVNDLDDSHTDTPDDDYIVGSTGVVKALQYCLGEAKAQEMRRSSAIATPTASGTATPRSRDRDQQMGLEIERRAKVKDMSKSLLGSARKIRGRLQLAIRKESANGDEMAYRRLLFLDQTLQRMIQRFEDEFPETRLPASSPSGINSVESYDSKLFPGSIATMASSVGGLAGDIGIQADSDDEDEGRTFLRPSRRGSEVSLASRALAQEEGHVLRFGVELRQEILKLESNAPSPQETPQAPSVESGEWDTTRLQRLKDSLEGLTGGEVKKLVEGEGADGKASMEDILARFGTTIQDLKLLKEQDPDGWVEFVDSQLAAKRNAEIE